MEDLSHLQDDFADDKDVQRARILRAEEEEFINDSIKTITEGLSLEPSEEKDDLGSFEIYRSIGKSPQVIDHFSSAAIDMQVFFVEYQWSRMGKYQRSTGFENCFIGLITLRKEYPLTYIYKEALRDKIVDWFVRGDVDFKECKAFSSKFHVVTKDKEKLSLLLLNKPLDEFIPFPDMLLELNGNRCMFRVSTMPLCDDEAAQFVELARTIRRILS